MKIENSSAEIFLLTAQWFDYRGNNVIRLVGVSSDSKPVEVVISNYKPVFFVERTTDTKKLKNVYLRKEVPMKNFSRNPVDAIYFNSQKDLAEAADALHKQGAVTYESDIDPVKRFLMEKRINAGATITGEARIKNRIKSFTNPVISPCIVEPSFTIASIDIETGEKNTKIYSIAIDLWGIKNETVVFIIDESEKNYPSHIIPCPDERTLMVRFIEWLNEKDPDIIIGWHVIGFDLLFLENKCRELNLHLDIGRIKGGLKIRTLRAQNFFATLPGRVIIDGPPSLRSAFYTFEDFKLETVAREVLGEGKLIQPDTNKVKEIERRFTEDKESLAAYNLQDAFLVSEIFRKTGLLKLFVKRAQLSGLLLDELGMMTAAFDHFYLPELHKKGYVAPNVKDIVTAPHAAGGYVLDPRPGIYDNVAVLDFKSLYPSIIRTFFIDPLSRLHSDINPVKTPDGKFFSSTDHLLPGIIKRLMSQRAEAVKNGDKYLSQAIKILMNSFYGVMGSYGCRFYHPHLPSAITGTGQWLLIQSRKFIEQQGFEVIYGDTDSLFVKLDSGQNSDSEKTSKTLVKKVNSYWKKRLKDEFGVESYLEMQFEKNYKKFILTYARNADVGAKKRYAGLKEIDGNEIIEFVGMESVRSDWTRLAKDFQAGLYKRVFNKEEVREWINCFVKKVYNGEFDDKLIYKKRLRKDVDEYKKNIPPQVKAARMLSENKGVVYYVMTQKGPVPAEFEPSDIDYNHYIEKQIKPVAESVLVLLGESFESIINSSQLDMFNDGDKD